MNSKVSIIIPVYNRAHLISDTLDSIFNQTYKDWECIVVDDGSTDNTKEVVQTFCAKDTRIQLFDRPSHKTRGGNAARNYGFSKSTGGFVQWFDSDDVLLPNFIEQKLKVFTEGLEFVIATCFATDDQLNKIAPIELNQTKNLYKDYTLSNIRIYTGFVLFRRSFLEGKRLFNEQIFRGQETELFSRLFYNISEDRYAILNKPLHLYRQHSNTKSSSHKKEYVSKFKKSLAFISAHNMMQGIELKDLEIVNEHYRILVHYFFEAIYHSDIKTAGFTYKFLKRCFLQSKSYGYLVKLYIVKQMLYSFKRTYYGLERSLKDYKISQI